MHPLHPPNSVIKQMYLEITNISQGLNIGILLLVMTTDSFTGQLRTTFYVCPVLAFTNLIISVIFWVRYYLDTEILDRSYTTLSMFWFFTFVVAQGLSISFITQPVAWFMTTGAFLLFGCGFYVLNLQEIRRKQAAAVLTIPTSYINWQRKRMIELIVMSILAFFVAYYMMQYPAWVYTASLICAGVAVWQLAITSDYRRLQFLRTGV